MRQLDNIKICKQIKINEIIGQIDNNNKVVLIHGSASMCQCKASADIIIKQKEFYAYLKIIDVNFGNILKSLWFQCPEFIYNILKQIKFRSLQLVHQKSH
eukprot:399330_1